MVGDDLAAVVADMVLIRVHVVGDGLSANVADVVIIRVHVVRDRLSANVTDVVIVPVLVVGDDLAAVVADVVLIPVRAAQRLRVRTVPLAGAGVGVVAVARPRTPVVSQRSDRPLTHGADHRCRAGGLCPGVSAVVARRPLGRQGHVLRHRRGKVILVSVYAVLVSVPPAEGKAVHFRIIGLDCFLARLDDLLGIDPAPLTVVIGHGDRRAGGVGDVGLVIDISAGVHGLAAELGVLVHGQPAIECAAGDVALRGDRAVERAAGEVAAEFPIVILGCVGHVPIRVQHSDAAMENTAPYVALAGDIAGEDRGRLPVRVVDGVGGLYEVYVVIFCANLVRSHIHRALHPAAVGIEEVAGIVEDKGVVKIRIDCGAVFDGACLGIVLFGGFAARDAGILPQLQLSKGDQGHAAAAFRLAAGDRSVQNRYLVCMAADIQAAAVVGGLAVLDAAAGDLDGTPGCQDAAAVLGRAAADDAAGHGDGAGLGIDRAAAGTVIG